MPYCFPEGTLQDRSTRVFCEQSPSAGDLSSTMGRSAKVRKKIFIAYRAIAIL